MDEGIDLRDWPSGRLVAAESQGETIVIKRRDTSDGVEVPTADQPSPFWFALLVAGCGSSVAPSRAMMMPA